MHIKLRFEPKIALWIMQLETQRHLFALAHPMLRELSELAAAATHLSESRKFGALKTPQPGQSYSAGETKRDSLTGVPLASS